MLLDILLIGAFCCLYWKRFLRSVILAVLTWILTLKLGCVIENSHSNFFPFLKYRKLLRKSGRNICDILLHLVSIFSDSSEQNDILSLFVNVQNIKLAMSGGHLSL